jgi:PIN domain nuclease of toxin-antitoxin system
MNKCILDASALLALINCEPGYKEVENVLAHSMMSCVNVSEVIAELYCRLNIKPEESRDMVDALTEIVPYDLNLAMMTASLRKETSHLGLSLGDRACLALGLHLSYPVYTADKIWKKFSIPSGIVLVR